MDKEEIEQLEKLLDKLRGHLGHSFAIAISTHDMYYIGIYSNQTGNLLHDTTNPTIFESVKKLKDFAL